MGIFLQKNDLESYVVRAVFFSIPLLPLATNIFVAIWAFLLIYKHKSIQFERILRHKGLVLFIVLYVLLCFGLIYTSDFTNGVGKLLTQAWFVIFPVLIGTKKWKPAQQLLYVRPFLFGLFVTALICYVSGFVQFMTLGSWHVVDDFGRSQHILFYYKFSEVFCFLQQKNH